MIDFFANFEIMKKNEQKNCKMNVKVKKIDLIIIKTSWVFDSITGIIKAYFFNSTKF